MIVKGLEAAEAEILGDTARCPLSVTPSNIFSKKLSEETNVILYSNSSES